MQRKLRKELEEISTIKDPREKIRQWTMLTNVPLLSLEDLLPTLSSLSTVSIPLEQHVVVSNEDTMKAHLVPAYAAAHYPGQFPASQDELEKSYRSLSYIALEHVWHTFVDSISLEKKEYEAHKNKIHSIEQSLPRLPTKEKEESWKMYEERIAPLKEEFEISKELSLRSRKLRQKNALLRLRRLEQTICTKNIDDAVSLITDANHGELQSWFEGRSVFTHSLLRSMIVPSPQRLQEIPFDFYAPSELVPLARSHSKERYAGMSFIAPVITSLAVAAMIWIATPRTIPSHFTLDQQFVSAIQREPPFVLDHQITLPTISLPKRIQLDSRDLTITQMDEMRITIDSPVKPNRWVKDRINPGLYIIRTDHIPNTMGEILSKQYFLAVDDTLHGGQIAPSQICYRLTTPARELIKEYFREETVKISLGHEPKPLDTIYPLSEQTRFIQGGHTIANIIGIMKDGDEHLIEVEFSLLPPIQQGPLEPGWSYPVLRKEVRVVQRFLETEVKKFPPVTIQSNFNVNLIPTVSLPISYTIDGETITLSRTTTTSPVNVIIPSRKFHDYSHQEGKDFLRVIELISDVPVASVNDLVSRTLIISSKNKVVRAAPLSLQHCFYTLDPIYEKAIASLSTPVSVNYQTLHGNRSQLFVAFQHYKLQGDEIVLTSPTGWMIPHRMTVHLKKEYPSLGIKLSENESNLDYTSVYQIPLPWASALKAVAE